MIQEMKFAAAQRKEITEFIFDEANWQAAKQVADVEDLLTKKVDATTIGPISAAISAPLADKAGIPVVVFGAFGKAMQSTVEIGAGGEIFGQQGGEFLRKELKGKGSVWAFRGIAGVAEEALRYNDFRQALAGSDIKISRRLMRSLATAAACAASTAPPRRASHGCCRLRVNPDLRVVPTPPTTLRRSRSPQPWAPRRMKSNGSGSSSRLQRLTAGG